MKLATTSIAILALAAAIPAAAQTTEKTPSSGPGVQGPPDTRTGPATRAPGQGAGGTGQGSASQGAASGGQGAAEQPMTSGGSAGVTQPSQDASGVEGHPGNKSGPAVKKPGSSSTR